MFLNQEVKKTNRQLFLIAKCLSSKNATKVNLGKIVHMNAVTVCTKNNVTT